jgi:hypothetical protein
VSQVYAKVKVPREARLILAFVVSKLLGYFEHYNHFDYEFGGSSGTGPMWYLHHDTTWSSYPKDDEE